MADQPAGRLDTTGLLCPIPIVKTSRKLEELEIGDRLVVLSDDPAFPDDLRSWSENEPHELIELEEREGTFQATIRKRRSDP